MTQRSTCQFDLFQSNEPPLVLPTAIEAEAFALLTQLLQSMIPVMEREVGDEQDQP